MSKNKLQSIYGYCHDCFFYNENVCENFGRIMADNDFCSYFGAMCRDCVHYQNKICTESAFGTTDNYSCDLFIPREEGTTEKMRKPKVKNKYKLKPKDIQRAIILDKDRLHQEPFWRNNAIDAWCLSETTIESSIEDLFGTYDEYWIGFYDTDAKAYAGKIRLNCTSWGGMCDYKFKTFFKSEDIEYIDDLKIQEKLLSRINWLIDEKIIEIPKKKKKKEK